MRASSSIGSLLLLVNFVNVGFADAAHPWRQPDTNNATRPFQYQKNQASKKRPWSPIAALVTQNNDIQQQQQQQHIPLLLKPWVYLYRALPKLYIKKQLDVSFTIASAVFLAIIDYTSAYLLSQLGYGESTSTSSSSSVWPRHEIRKLAGSITTIFHSTVLCLGLGACFASQKYKPSCKMNVHPNWWQDASTALIQFCTGYMIYDALVQTIADRWQWNLGRPILSLVDWLFIGHHAATAIYMTSTRLVHAGHMSAMILMLAGEITAPIMNLLRIFNILTQLNDVDTQSNNNKRGAFLLQVWKPRIETIFAFMYVACRTIVGPIVTIHLTYDLLFTLEGRTNIPIGLSLTWLTMVWLVLLGSWPWIRNSIQLLRGLSIPVL